MTATVPAPPEVAGPVTPVASRGMQMGLAAYVMWGLFPLYFVLLTGVGAVETVAHRVAWSLLFCVVLLGVLGRRLGGGTAELRRISRGQVAGLALAAMLLSVNWAVFIYGVGAGQVVQVSLGYFTLPLVSVALGVLFLGERLRRWQWAAVAIGAGSVVVLSVADGRPPWIALALAGSFGLYGLLKNRVGRGVAALPGMTIETAVLAPLAIGYLVWLQVRGSAAFGSSPATTVLLILTGPLTAGVLLLFAAAARRVRLSTLGLMQYVTPVLQFVAGVALLGERMSPSRLAGFVLIWVALVILSIDSLKNLAKSET